MLKCAIFADYLDFEKGCFYLNTMACKRRKKNMGFLHFCLRINKKSNPCVFWLSMVKRAKMQLSWITMSYFP